MNLNDDDNDSDSNSGGGIKIDNNNINSKVKKQRKSDSDQLGQAGDISLSQTRSVILYLADIWDALFYNTFIFNEFYSNVDLNESGNSDSNSDINSKVHHPKMFDKESIRSRRDEFYDLISYYEDEYEYEYEDDEEQQQQQSDGKIGMCI